MTIIQSNGSPLTENPLYKYERNIPEIVAEECQSSNHGRPMPSIGSELALYQLKVTYSNDSAKWNTIH